MAGIKGILFFLYQSTDIILPYIDNPKYITTIIFLFHVNLKCNLITTLYYSVSKLYDELFTRYIIVLFTLIIFSLVILAFMGSIGMTCVILACALPNYK